jgi:hypothetical protein
MITPLRLFEIYNATTLTFKGKYNCTKYNFKIKTRPEYLERHNGKFVFVRLAKQLQTEREAEIYVFSNIISGNQWIGGFDKESYFRYVQLFENIDYIFEELVKKYYGGNFKNFKNAIIENLDKDDLDFINFVTLLNMLTNGKLMDRLDGDIDDGFLFDEFKQKILTYTPFFDRFCQLDSERRKKLLSKLPK